MVVIAHAGPLIALARLDLLGILKPLYQEVTIPTIVWNEIVGDRSFSETPLLINAQLQGLLVVAESVPNAELDPTSSLWMIDAGERAALELGLKLSCFCPSRERTSASVACLRH
jgi:predicted nucleic acid-binding protein